VNEFTKKYWGSAPIWIWRPTIADVKGVPAEVMVDESSVAVTVFDVVLLVEATRLSVKSRSRRGHDQPS